MTLHVRGTGRCALAGALFMGALPGGASAAGLSLVPIAGPDGTVPFKSGGPAHVGPVYVASPPGDTHRTFVLTQDGYVYVIVDGVLRPTPFLDVDARTGSVYNGLFTIAFDPGYGTNRRFYVNYTDTSAGDDNRATQVVVSYLRSATDPDRADPATARTLFSVPSPGCPDQSAARPDGMVSAHYGGQMNIGPDGLLWLSVGDGGDGCDD